MVRRNADGTLFVGEVVEETKTAKAGPIQDDFEQEDMFMNEPVEDDTPEPEKPRNKGGRPRKR